MKKILISRTCTLWIFILSFLILITLGCDSKKGASDLGKVDSPKSDTQYTVTGFNLVYGNSFSKNGVEKEKIATMLKDFLPKLLNLFPPKGKDFIKSVKINIELDLCSLMDGVEYNSANKSINICNSPNFLKKIFPIESSSVGDENLLLRMWANAYLDQMVENGVNNQELIDTYANFISKDENKTVTYCSGGAPFESPIAKNIENYFSYLSAIYFNHKSIITPCDELKLRELDLNSYKIIEKLWSVDK